MLQGIPATSIVERRRWAGPFACSPCPTQSRLRDLSAYLTRRSDCDVTMDEYPNTAQVVCANIVLRDDHLLLVRESKRAALGRWSLPAGRLEVGESLREGAAREALEETGLRVEVGALLGIYHCPTSLEGGAAVHFVFRSEVCSGQLRTTAQQPEVTFVSRLEVDDLLDKNLIRGQHVRLALQAADAGTALPVDLVAEVGPSPPPTA